MRIGREEWAKRVARWGESGLTAKEFAAKLGINPRSLVFWKWQLSRESKTAESAEVGKRLAAKPRPLPLVEITAPREALGFELELRGGRRLTIPASFDGEVLHRLLAVLERST